MYLHKLQQDNFFILSELKPLSELTGVPSRKGLENAIISYGKIVNIVSKSYGHIPNEVFFKQAEQKLIDAGLDFYKRTINRDDRTFSTDFILRDTNHFTLIMSPMKSYPCYDLRILMTDEKKPLGILGSIDKVCSNALHIANIEIAFSIKHSRHCTEMILPSIDRLFQKFL
jgi:hypothetical protein